MRIADTLSIDISNAHCGIGISIPMPRLFEGCYSTNFVPVPELLAVFRRCRLTCVEDERWRWYHLPLERVSLAFITEVVVPRARLPALSVTTAAN